MMKTVAVFSSFLAFSSVIATPTPSKPSEYGCWTNRVFSDDGRKSVCPDDCRPYVDKDPAKTYCKFRGGKRPRCSCPWPSGGCADAEPKCKWHESKKKKRKFKCKCKKAVRCDPVAETRRCEEVLGGLFSKCVCAKKIPSDAPSDVPSDAPSDSPADAPSDVPSDAPSAPRAPVMMHVMPWFKLWRPDGSSPSFKNSHWTDKLDRRDDLYLAGRYKRLGRVASHYTPLIGPYDSSDPATVRLQVRLMALAGLDGIILNWYGTQDKWDYPDNLVASDVILKEASAAGLAWTVCYEDRTLDPNDPVATQDAQLVADWTYLRDAYVLRLPGILRDPVTGRPIFYLFGPEVVRSRARWESALAVVFPAEADRPLLQGVNPAKADYLPDGIFHWPGGELFPTVERVEQVQDFNRKFYSMALDHGWRPVTGAVYARFRDYYKEGSDPEKDPEEWWGNHVQDLGGGTLRQCLDDAEEGGAEVVQVVTWNDWQEGTAFEPSYEEGFTQLLRLQEYLQGRSDEGPMAAAVKEYNRENADEWRHCDNMAEEDRKDCGFAGVTQQQCEDKGCCYRPTETRNLSDGTKNHRPWCYHRSSAPVCKCADASIRDCEVRPLDRLCCCKH